MIPIARPEIGRDEVNAVAKVMMSGNLTSGEHVKNFESAYAQFCGVRHAVATNNGTAALHAALLAAGVGRGDEVIVPDFSFIATATAVSMTGATPIFVDVDADTFNIKPENILYNKTEKTKAVIGVHLFGHPFDAEGIKQICEKYNLYLIEDAAQAHGAKIGDKRVGSFGDMACFSFYGTKNMTTGEGGMVTTNNELLNDRLRMIINHGQAEKYLHTSLGYNYRMTDIAAAIGEVQLGKLNQFNQQRLENANFYSANIYAKGIELPTESVGITHVYHQYVLRLTDEFEMGRTSFMKYLQNKHIGCAIHYPLPIHMQPIYHQLTKKYYRQTTKSCKKRDG